MASLPHIYLPLVLSLNKIIVLATMQKEFNHYYQLKIYVERRLSSHLYIFLILILFLARIQLNAFG